MPETDRTVHPDTVERWYCHRIHDRLVLRNHSDAALWHDAEVYQQEINRGRAKAATPDAIGRVFEALHTVALELHERRTAAARTAAAREAERPATVAKAFVPEIGQVVTGCSIRKDRDITGLVLQGFEMRGHIIAYLIEVSPGYRDMVDADSVRLAPAVSAALARVRIIVQSDMDDDAQMDALRPFLEPFWSDVDDGPVTS